MHDNSFKLLQNITRVTYFDIEQLKSNMLEKRQKQFSFMKTTWEFKYVGGGLEHSSSYAGKRVFLIRKPAHKTYILSDRSSNILFSPNSLQDCSSNTMRKYSSVIFTLCTFCTSFLFLKDVNYQRDKEAYFLYD